MEIVQKLISVVFSLTFTEKPDDLFTLIEPFRARVQQLVKKNSEDPHQKKVHLSVNNERFESKKLISNIPPRLQILVKIKFTITTHCSR